MIRSLDLIANFENGYARGWVFAVGECFRDQLDIKYTERVNTSPDGKKRIISQWTQGPYFCFNEGHILYDSPNGYLPWKEALKSFNFQCEILRASPCVTTPSRGITPGSVIFKLSSPDEKRESLKTIGQYHLSQSKFVEFLKIGTSLLKK